MCWTGSASARQVDLFFVISGFIMCHTTARHGVTIAAFLRNRLIRILPLYWILTTVALAANMAMPGRVNSSGGETHVLASYVLLPTDGKYLVQAGWTLAYEFYFYFLFAGGLLSRGWRGRAAVITALVSLAGIGWQAPSPHQIWRFATNDLLLEFAYGMLLYALYQQRVVKHWSVGLLLVAGGIALLAGANQAPNQEFLSPVRALNYGVPAWLVCSGFVFLEEHLARRKVRCLEALGDASYSLYLTHVFVVGALAMVAGSLPHLGIGMDRVTVPLMVAAAVLAAHLCYRWVEHPSRVALKDMLHSPPGALRWSRCATPTGS